jgi:ubiquinone/menaquinone biosynthesis C-methylase UbiE
MSWDEPHRTIISAFLQRLQNPDGTLRWLALVEFGCGTGENLENIVRNFQSRQVGGVDSDPKKIAIARPKFKNAFLKVCPMDDIMLSDNSTDVVLTDGLFARFKNPAGCLSEVKRVGRKYAIFCELHSTNVVQRLKERLYGWRVYDWKKLLTKHGFYDIELYKIPKGVWSVRPWTKYGTLIVATILKI